MLKTELKQIRAYYSTQTLSKILITLAFFAVFAFLEWLIFRGTRQYFYLLAATRDYIKLTADYIIKAIVLILFYLGTGSSLIATITSLQPSKTLNFLLTQPVKISKIILWQFQKQTILNALLLSIPLFPITASYARAFQGGITIFFIFKFIFLLLLLSSVTVATGSLLAHLFLLKLKKPNFYKTIFILSSFILILIQLFRSIFPPSLQSLARATPEEFDRIYANLPLTSPLLSSLPFLLFLSSIIVSISLYFQQKYFKKIYLYLAAYPAAAGHSYSQFSFKKLSPIAAIISKDFLSLFRSRTETGYALFLLSLVAFFFILFSKIKLNPTIPDNWQNSLTIFSFLGLTFFANTFLLRMAFPAMAREGESLWFLQTLPLKKNTLFSSKLFFSILLCFPFYIIPFFIFPTYLAIVSCLTIVFSGIFQGLLGQIHPNYEEAASSEKISTSTMGLVTLILCTAMSLLVAQGLNLHLQQNPAGFTIIILTFSASILLSLFLSIWHNRS